jgi:hypothetical protein
MSVGPDSLPDTDADGLYDSRVLLAPFLREFQDPFGGSGLTRSDADGTHIVGHRAPVAPSRLAETVARKPYGCRDVAYLQEAPAAASAA